MMKTSRISFAAAVVFSATGFAASDRDTEELVQTSDRQVTIAFHLKDFKLDTLRSDGGASSLRPSFAQAIFLNNPGAPQLPARVIITGIPFGARAEVSVTPSAFDELSGIDVPPVCAPTPKDGSASWRSRRDPQVYARNAFYPAELARLDPPVQFRQQTIVRVQVMPVQYNPVQKRLRVYRELKIEVRFIGGRTAAATTAKLSTSRAEEKFYESVLINYAPAQAIRAPRPAPLSRRATAASQIEGPLYKFPVRQEGLYKIDGRTLANAEISSINPGTIHLYNNGGRELPREFNAPRPAESLVENAIYVSDGGDGRFDNDDYILFYGRGVDGFAFDSTTGLASHYSNHFGYDNYYWLSFGGGNGKRMAQRAPLPAAGLTPVTTFTDHLFVEEDRVVLFESDQCWFSFEFAIRGAESKRYVVKLIDPVAESAARLLMAFYTPPNGTSNQLTVSFNQQDLAELPLRGYLGLDYYNADKLGGLINGDNEILFTYQASGDVARVYLDYFELRYERQLRLNAGALIFNGRAGAGPLAYTLQNAEASSLWLFDVSDFSQVVRLSSQNWQANGTQVTFADAGVAGKVPRRYLAATPAAFRSIEANTIRRDEISNWRTPNHGADMVVITHQDFLSINPVTGKDEGPLARFVSLRQNANINDTLKVVVVKIQDVFDEFSCGMYDPVAIRDFLRYAYENWSRRPVFVMLVGDGDYDPKNVDSKTDKNWIPTFHTDDFDFGDFVPNRVSDSQFTYVAGDDKTMDMAIGRIPARSLAEVEAYVQKLIRYETVPAFGSWRNTAVMVADDELWENAAPLAWETAHIEQTEFLVSNRTPAYLDVKKIYLTEFPVVQAASISGVRKPAATEAILRLINNGALIVNYIGHGAYNLLSHERVLVMSSDFEQIQNGDRQALWIAATCTFGKYDIPGEQSFSEQLLLAPGRGAIAVLATARDVYSVLNAQLNWEYYRFLFEGSIERSARIGEAMVWARMETASTENDEKFHVLGDPSLRLAVPRYSASITAIKPDTIKALAVMTVQGKIQRDGVDWPGFKGTARLEAFDAQREVNYQSPGQFEMAYALPGNSLFRGEVPVQNGAFTARFFVPKDITYGGETGRINLYFWNSTTDGNGYRERLPVGGTANLLVDKAGPSISIGFDGVENFYSGDVVGTHPVMRATIADSISGVNITGEIGHKITLMMDGRTDDKIDLTDLFNYDSGSYTIGAVSYPLGELAPGRHALEMKAWDNLNNSNTVTVEFMVQPQDRLILSQVMNYPNPFRRRTTFTFELNLAAETQIKIFTLSGRLIRTLENFGARPGFNMMEWDGQDADGDELANGVYLYKIIATQWQSGAGLRTEEIGKLVVQR